MTKLTVYQRWWLNRLEKDPQAFLRLEEHGHHTYCQYYQPPKWESVRVNTFHLLLPYLEEVGQEHGYRLFRLKRQYRLS